MGLKSRPVGAVAELRHFRVEVAVHAQPHARARERLAERSSRWSGRTTPAIAKPLSSRTRPRSRRTASSAAPVRRRRRPCRPAAVQLRRRRRFRPDRALRQRVSRPPEIRRGQRMQPQIAGTLGERPLGVVRHVIPLPDGLELRAREIVAAIVRRSDRLDVPGVRLHPDRRRALEVPRQTEVGPAVHPRDRRERRQAADGVVVLHGEAPPFARRRVDDPALVQRQAQRARWNPAD